MDFNHTLDNTAIRQSPEDGESPETEGGLYLLALLQQLSSHGLRSVI
jgi:hypothetical protein